MMTVNKSNKFNFFIPATFEKSGELGELKIKGVCSSNVEDSDGEFLDPSGFDYTPLLEKGFFNWNHQANKEAGAIIGRPTSASIVNGGKDFYVEGTLYKGLKQAQDVYNLAQVLENEDPDRRLGFSIEGQAVERDPINPKRIRKARITGVAITHCPKNPNTLLSIMKGEYSEPFIDEDEDNKEDKETEKSMSVDINLNPPSIETKEKKLLSKSQVYDSIFTRYTKEIAKADSIYELAKQTSLKLFKMENITEESLQKAFEILDSSIIKSDVAKTPADYDKKDELMKNEEVKEEGKKKKEDEDEEEDEVEKAKECIQMAKSLLESGLNKGEVVDKLIEKGFSMTMCQGCVDKAINDASANKDGGDITAFDKLGKSLTETVFERLEKSEASMNSNFRALIEGIDVKFGALSQILKGQNTDSETIGKTIDEIQKSQEAIAARLEDVENTPIPGKAVVGSRAFEKFAKSEQGNENLANTYSLSKSEDRSALTGRLFAEFETSNRLGRPNKSIEKAIMDIEISKSISASEIPTMKSLGINIIQ